MMTASDASCSTSYREVGLQCTLRLGFLQDSRWTRPLENSDGKDACGDPGRLHGMLTCGEGVDCCPSRPGPTLWEGLRSARLLQSES